MRSFLSCDSIFNEIKSNKLFRYVYVMIVCAEYPDTKGADAGLAFLAPNYVRSVVSPCAMMPSCIR